MNRPDIEGIEKRAKAATEGPWDNEAYYISCRVNDGSWDCPGYIKPDRCSHCAETDKPFKTIKDGPHTYHTHRYQGRVDWHDIYSGNGEPITGNYDYEEGGICSTREDSDFIAHSRTDIPELIAYIRHLEAANKRIEQETAFKCAYLAWQFSLDEYTEKPERVICREYGINLDSLYAARWKDLEKK